MCVTLRTYFDRLPVIADYTIYSREQDRMHSEANVTAFDLHDSYLPQYEEAFKANASGALMGLF